MRRKEGKSGAAVVLLPLLLGSLFGEKSGGLMGVCFITLSYYFLVGAVHAKRVELSRPPQPSERMMRRWKLGAGQLRAARPFQEEQRQVFQCRLLLKLMLKSLHNWQALLCKTNSKDLFAH